MLYAEPAGKQQLSMKTGISGVRSSQPHTRQVNLTDFGPHGSARTRSLFVLSAPTESKTIKINFVKSVGPFSRISFCD